MEVNPLIRTTRSKLSNPIIYEGNTIDEKIQNGMNNFYNIFLKKEIKPKYKDVDIFFDMNRIYQRSIVMPYPLSFMHIISLNNDEKYNLFPCTNDISNEICENNCTSHSALPRFQAYNRWECMYRLSRIHWIPEIIQLANIDDPDVYIFTENKNDGKHKFVDYNIRYLCGVDDYLIILRAESRRSDLLFITAYPVVSVRKKEDLNIKCKK